MTNQTTGQVNIYNYAIESLKSNNVEVGDKARFKCVPGLVKRASGGECFKVHDVTCSKTDNGFPVWTFDDNSTSQCFPGCADDGDCRIDDFCNPKTCHCQPKLCQNFRVKDGFIQVHLDGNIGATATLVCLNGTRPECNDVKTSNVMKLKCVNLNSNPEWRTNYGHCLPTCVPTEEPVNATKPHQICKENECKPIYCPEPDLSPNARVVSLSSTEVGSLAEVSCEPGFRLKSGLTSILFVCRAQSNQTGKFVPLDGISRAICLPGL